MQQDSQSEVEDGPAEDWDPLQEAGPDPGILIAAQRREINNILKSYTGYYDLFSELIQNALDAVERRRVDNPPPDYAPSIWISIDLVRSFVSVTDNGCGMTYDQFRTFLKPSYSFKDGSRSRGSKGVGATYLAYGFNYLELATTLDGRSFSGLIQRGRDWVEDATGTIPRPKVQTWPASHAPYHQIDRGTTMTVRLVGSNIRPKNLGWLNAVTAQQWISVLRVTTPLGDIYLCGNHAPSITIHLEVISASGEATTVTVRQPEYLYPHLVMTRVAYLRDFLADQQRRLARGADITRIPAKFQKPHGLWGEWNWQQILGEVESDCPIQPRLEDDERQLVRELGIKLYIFLAFSTDLWDQYNDEKLRLRRSQRLLRGGL